ncbi:MAG: hypothetical protein KGK30_10145, partial [Elusimicrobia bacterium]|nr:hypothetical protein [Elusimicrobiota bacterium]
AGDAKLFVLLEALLLYLLPRAPYSPLRLSLTHLTNIFVLAAAFFLLEPLARKAKGGIGLGARRAAAAALEQARSGGLALLGAARRQLGGQLPPLLALYVLSLLWYRWVAARFGSSAMLYAVLGGAMAARWLGGAMARGRLVRIQMVLAAALALLVLGRLHDYETARDIALDSLRMAGYWAFAGAALGILCERFESPEAVFVDCEKLMPSMVLSGQFVETLRADSSFDMAGLGKLYPDGLRAGQTAYLRRWCKAKNIPVLVYRSYPFAFWMFAGTWLTLLIRRDVVSMACRLL